MGAILVPLVAHYRARGAPGPGGPCRRLTDLPDHQRGGAIAARAGPRKKVMAVCGIGARSRAGRPHVYAHPDRQGDEVDPQAWLADVPAPITDPPQTRLAELPPWKWSPTFL
jgi:hypothetical protein